MDAVPERVDAVPERVDAVPERVDAVPERVDTVPGNGVLTRTQVDLYICNSKLTVEK